jgi:membrane-associated phospholipid phosphatase
MSRFKKHRLWLVVLSALTIAPVLIAYDISIAALTYKYPLPRFASRILEINAYFVSNGFGVLIVLAGLLLLRRTYLRQATYLGTASLGAGILADIVKICVFRSRPNVVSLPTATFASTFHGFLPLFSAGSHGQSFPSGHAAVAAGLATSLSVTFPKWRWLVIPLGIAAAVSRVAVHVHFPTDVLVGVTIGVCWTITSYPKRIVSLFESLLGKIVCALPNTIRLPRLNFENKSRAKLDKSRSVSLDEKSRAA